MVERDRVFLRQRPPCLYAATTEGTNMRVEVARAYREFGMLVQGPLRD
jgi:hypothetical protein